MGTGRTQGEATTNEEVADYGTSCQGPASQPTMFERIPTWRSLTARKIGGTKEARQVLKNGASTPCMPEARTLSTARISLKT